MAGKGTRLRPFTLTCPKPLLKIIDKPIVEHLIDQITSRLTTQIDEIIYILGDEAYFNSDVVSSLTLIAKKYNAKTKVYRQLDQLGTGHAIMCAEESLHGPSIVAYADTMIQGQISIAPDVDGIIWVKKVEDPSSYGVVSLDEKNNIIDLIEKKLKIGNVELKAIELCRPCRHLTEMLDQKNILKEFMRKGGLRCQILTSSKINIGDKIELSNIKVFAISLT